MSMVKVQFILFPKSYCNLKGESLDRVSMMSSELSASNQSSSMKLD